MNAQPSPPAGLCLMGGGAWGTLRIQNVGGEMMDCKIVAHVYESCREAEYEFDSFINGQDNLSMVMRQGLNMRATLENGETHYFLPLIVYDRWAHGRTYTLSNDSHYSAFAGDFKGLYHSGYPVGEEK